MIYLASPIHSKIKLFAENTSIFPVVYDTHKNADNITKQSVNGRTNIKWIFSIDLIKEAPEVIASRKTTKSKFTNLNSRYFFMLLVTCLNSQKISKTLTRPAFSTISKAFVGTIRITEIWAMRRHIINPDAKNLNPCNTVTALTWLVQVE